MLFPIPSLVPQLEERLGPVNTCSVYVRVPAYQVHQFIIQIVNEAFESLVCLFYGVRSFPSYTSLSLDMIRVP